MGQGHSISTLSAATATLDVPELADVHVDKTIASARFTKSVRARSQNGLVYIKIVMKPYSSFDVSKYIEQVTRDRDALSNIPNALGFQKVVEASTCVFLVRQYFFSSIYDRLSTRPFMEDIEKRWLVYQLLCAVRDCHLQNIYHGDIKTENLMVTSWNWLYLTDFSASFKPTHLPEDNPANFSFYFDTSSRRICYLAPERFIPAGSSGTLEELNWAMDMFGAGCTIAEIFLEEPVFTLSQIFKYKMNDYDPAEAHINSIQDEEIRAMVLNMIDLDPEKRYSAEQHLSFYKGKIFPEYFYSFLHDYMHDLTDPVVSKPLVLDNGLLLESDRKIDQVYQDFDKISYFLGYTELNTEVKPKAARKNYEKGSGHEGTLLFLTLVCSSIRNTAKSSARLRACDLLTSLALRLPDEAKLDRVLPYLAGLLSDDTDTVKIAALYAVTQLLESIQVVSPINAFLLPEYIFVRLRSFLPNDSLTPSALVRAAYASCLASLALSSARMLDMVQAIRADGRVPSLSDEVLTNGSSFQNLYDVARSEIVPFFEHATTTLITDPDSSVRRALLSSISRLCMFFGSGRASDVILSYLNTYLNEHDWLLKCAFHDALVGVATYIGTSSLERYILPLMMGSLVDSEHFVVEKVIRSFARIAALGLFQKSILWDLSCTLSRFLVHPSIWIREAAAQFVEHACVYLSPADRYCIMLPILQPFLRAPIIDFTEVNLLDKLKTPLSRSVFEAAVLWAARKPTSVFWTAASRDGALSVMASDTASNLQSFGKKLLNRIPLGQKDKDDQQSLENLRHFGFVPDDEVKLIALRKYILKYSQYKSEEGWSRPQEVLGDIVSLAQFEVTPQNVFFDADQPYRRRRSSSVGTIKRNLATKTTIKDALLEASTSDATSRRQITPGSVADSVGDKTPAITIKQDVVSPSESLSSSLRIGSFDQRNVRAGSLRSPRERSSSIGGRHALLRPERSSSDYKAISHLIKKNSAVSLLSRAETTKAEAELSTTQENVFGRVDTPSMSRTNTENSLLSQTLQVKQKSRSRSPLRDERADDRVEARSSYTGSNPTIMTLLNNHVAENAPVDLLDFGALVQPIDTALPTKTANDPQTAVGQPAVGGVAIDPAPWQPSGALLTTLAEHSAAITKVAIAPDHAFFVTASNDGTCKIWDTHRLEKNISARSRQTHKHSDGAEVRSLCFVENTHTFISAASDGSIHAVRIELGYIEGTNAARFSKPILVRDWQIPHEQPQTARNGTDNGVAEYAVDLHHYRARNSQSVLLIVTNKCRILMVDMKNMSVIHIMHNPVHHGTPTALCVDRRHHWLLLGSSHGILDLWDLRFKLHLRTFGIGGAGFGQRVDRLLLHPSTRGNGRLVITSCGGEISIWDIEKMVCKEVLRPASFSHDTSHKPRNYEVWRPDEEAPEAMLARFAASVTSDPDRTQPDMTPADASTVPSTSTISRQTQTREHILAATAPTSTKASHLFTAGTDRTLRMWNLSSPDQSTIISGPMLNIPGEENLSSVRYEVSWPTSMSLSGLIMLVEERLGQSSPTSIVDEKGKKKAGTAAAGSSGGGNTRRDGEKRTVTTPSSKTPRNAMISLAQQQMLRTHMDGITDVAVLRKPYGCIVSVDRGGAIYIFH